MATSPERSDDDERFELRGELGAGSSGTVYRVLDRRRGHEVALKVLRRLGGADLYRFKREFRSLVGLHHPNLATLYELYAVGDEWMYTMELVDGARFDRWVRPGGEAEAIVADDDVGTTALPRRRAGAGTLDVDRLRAALAQLADGLTALHAVGKIHRDLKPSNVMVDGSGRVVILDFGLVIDITQAERTHDGKAIGTVAYMSPEQAADLPLSPASDWYAVGVMLYEALAGVRPFRGAAHDVLLRKQLDAPPPPSTLAPDVPADLDDLCARLLARDPDRRPTGAEVLAALGVAPSAASIALTERPRLPPPPAPALAALHQALADSRDRFVTVVVTGGPGSGKSTLCEQFVEEAEARVAARALVARNDGREQSRFPGLDQVIDQLGTMLLAMPADAQAALAPIAQPIARVFPTLRRVPALHLPALPGASPLEPDQLLARALSAFRDVLRHLGADRPVLLVVDGGHHITPVGAATIAHIYDAADLPRALFVMTQRSEPGAGRAALVEIERWHARGGDLRWIDLDA
ncbi:MAG TPA: serine/threonine-protein kinase [Kofleriaceae bacterium]|nr:serine/threonine-protein kinase [Kofleriaceae bacterium]